MHPLYETSISSSIIVLYSIYNACITTRTALNKIFTVNRDFLSWNLTQLISETKIWLNITLTSNFSLKKPQIVIWTFAWKFPRTKNEICPFRWCYFCTILYCTYHIIKILTCLYFPSSKHLLNILSTMASSLVSIVTSSSGFSAL